MNMKKIISSIAAIAMTASLMTVAADATNWANASYSDDDPNTVKIIATSEDKVEFTSTSNGAQAKARVTVGDLLTEEDAAKVKSATWTVTYTIPEGTVAGSGVGGGTYFGCKNSTGYWINPDYDDNGNPYWANTTYSINDEAKFLLPTEVLTAESELVFIDWSCHEALTTMTIAISDLKFFDADGNEISQKAYVVADEAEAPAEDTTAAAEEETAEEVDDVAADVEDDADEVTAEVEDEAEEVSVDDTAVDEAAVDTAETTTAAATGNAAAASIVAVMAVAGAAAVATKKRK